MSARAALCAAALALALAGCGNSLRSADVLAEVEDAQHSSDLVRYGQTCEDRDDWDKPAKPFQVHGNTWYVGTCGITALLVRGKGGAVLIDAGTARGSEVVAANVASLGVRLADVKAILGSHEHFDHAGGFARMQAASGAPVLVGAGAVEVIRSGKVDPADPQFGRLEAMAPVPGTVRGVTDGEVIDIAGVKLTAIATPGHSPGAMSWTWQSCGRAGCKTIVYADSLNPISNDTYRFSNRPQIVAAFRAGIAKVRAAKCDILLTPHPSASEMIARARTGTLVDGMTCAQYADARTLALDERLAREAAAK